jgi:hypothetical protein
VLGELKSQTNAKLQTSSFTYDKLGRPLNRVGHDLGLGLRHSSQRHRQALDSLLHGNAGQLGAQAMSALLKV